MTKAAAMQSFWESFGLPAYEENSVPENAGFPRITYQFITDVFDRPVAFSVSLWYRTTSNVEINAKADEISKRIGRSGCFLDFEDGTICIERGSPFSQNMSDPEDKIVKRKILNLTAEYWSAD